jgi:serine/threonine protein kinase
MPDDAPSRGPATHDPNDLIELTPSLGDAATDPGDPTATDPDRTDLHVPGAPPPTARPGLPGYAVEGELGRGGMGVVYQARHLKLNRPAALKMVLGDTRAESKEIIRFLAEAAAVAAIDHPHVVRVYEFGEAAGRPFLALELCPGGSLADKLTAAGRLAPAAAAELVR